MTEKFTEEDKEKIVSIKEKEIQMKPIHINCRCVMPEEEITCTKAESDYQRIEVPEKEIIRIDDFERIKKYNKDMKDTCPDFKPWPTNQEELDKLMHEKAIETAGGIENLNFAKVLVGEMTIEEAKEQMKK